MRRQDIQHRIITSEIRLAERHNKALETRQMWNEYEKEQSHHSQKNSHCDSLSNHNNEEQTNKRNVNHHHHHHHHSSSSSSYKPVRCYYKHPSSSSNNNISRPETRNQEEEHKGLQNNDKWYEERRRQRKKKKRLKQLDIENDVWKGDLYYTEVTRRASPYLSILDVLEGKGSKHSHSIVNEEDTSPKHNESTR